jgi:hypothetical protein
LLRSSNSFDVMRPWTKAQVRWNASGLLGYSALADRDTEKLLMRIVDSLIVATIFSSALALGAQQTAPSPAQSQAVPAALTGSGAGPSGSPSLAAPAAPTASSLLQPSLDSIRQTLATVKVDRWKRGSVRDEANSDIKSIAADLQQRVPSLLKDADASPGTLSKTLPVSRHIDALYDVLLRVVEASRMAAPDDQANSLRQALEGLEKARLALDDSMEQSASSQEKQLVDLRVTVQKQAAFKCPAPPPPQECPKAPVKKPVRKKPAATNGAPASGTTPNGAGQKLPAGQAPAAGTQQKPTAGKPNPQAQKPQ